MGYYDKLVEYYNTHTQEEIDAVWDKSKNEIGSGISVHKFIDNLNNRMLALQVKNSNVGVNKKYNNAIYVNQYSTNCFVVVERELSKTMLLMKGGEIWSKNRLGRCWKYLYS